MRASITKRNLIYFVAPFLGNDVWKRNVAQLLRRWELFNGQRIITIATGPGMMPPAKVTQCFGGRDTVFLFTSHSPAMREGAGFYEMMDRIKSIAPDEATFFAHAKGVTHGGNEMITHWRNSMYHYLLDDWPNVDRVLQDHSCAGCFRVFNHPGTLRSFGHLAPELVNSEWHYSGTFWWFRNGAIFSQNHWRSLPMTAFGVEFYLASLIRHVDAACLYQDNPVGGYSHQPEPYPDPTNWYEIFPKLTRVEFGGGDKPQPGFTNLDQQDDADIKIDLAAVARGEIRTPFADNTVDEVYSSHFLEHVTPAMGVLEEICRVCKVGAMVEIRVPHWLHSCAMCDSIDSRFSGHKHVFGPRLVYYLCEEAPQRYWRSAKRLRLIYTHYQPEVYFEEAKKLFPQMTDEQIFRFVPETCHEIRYNFEVIANG